MFAPPAVPLSEPGYAHEAGAGIAVQPAGKGAIWSRIGCIELTNFDRAYALRVWFSGTSVVTRSRSPS